jgi:hypothetical protein
MYRRMGLLLVPSSVRKILLMSVYTCYFVVVAVVVGAVSIGACIAIASRLALGVPVVGPWPVLPVAVSVCVAFTLDLKMWFLVCFCGRVRVRIRLLPPVLCFSLIWSDGQMTSLMILFSCASFIFFIYFVCHLLINSFRFSLFYTELPTKAIRTAYPLQWV